MDKFIQAQNHKKEELRNSSCDRVILLTQEWTVHIEEEKKWNVNFIMLLCHN